MTPVATHILEEKPVNFASVDKGIYRSGFPTHKNFSFLAKLKLRSIICLCTEEYPTPNRKFIVDENIQLFHFGMDGNKESKGIRMPKDKVCKALNVIMDPKNHPILIHCNAGKHRTGCIVGCYRKLKRWSIPVILQEYTRYAGSKARALDKQFIIHYDIDSKVSCENSNNSDRDVA